MVLPSLRSLSTALSAAGRFHLSSPTTVRGTSAYPGSIRPVRALRITTAGRREHWRGSFLSTLSPSSHMIVSKNDENEAISRPKVALQVRSYHATRREEIVAPFIPEMILFVVVAGGWTAYRTYKGKPLTPDEALQAQEAYRKHEEKLRRQWQEHHKKHRSG